MKYDEVWWTNYDSCWIKNHSHNLEDPSCYSLKLVLAQAQLVWTPRVFYLMLSLKRPFPEAEVSPKKSLKCEGCLESNICENRDRSGWTSEQILTVYTIYIYIYTCCVDLPLLREYWHMDEFLRLHRMNLLSIGRTSGASSSSSPSGTSDEMCSSMEGKNLCLKIRLLEKHSYSFICSHIHS